MRKNSLEDIQLKSNKIHNNEYLFIGDYINYDTPILIKHLKCEYEWCVRVGNHLSGKRCPKCQKNAKLSIEDIQLKSNEIHNNEYLILDKTKNIIKIKHKICGYEWNSKYGNHIYSRCGCPMCNGGSILTKNIVQKRSDEMYNGEFDIIGEYINIDTPIHVRHKICGYEWDLNLNNHINKLSKCPKCYGNIKHTHDEILNLIPEGYLLMEKYKSLSYKHIVKHIDCDNMWNTSLKHFLFGGKRCPFCRLSKGEVGIKKFLDRENIKYVSQYTTDCEYVKKLVFDFYLEDMDIYIEYDGVQHFKPIEFFGGKIEFQKRIERDRIKNEFCGDKLIRISYLDDVESIMQKILK